MKITQFSITLLAEPVMDRGWKYVTFIIHIFFTMLKSGTYISHNATPPRQVLWILVVETFCPRNMVYVY